MNTFTNGFRVIRPRNEKIMNPRTRNLNQNTSHSQRNQTTSTFGGQVLEEGDFLNDDEI